MNLTRPWRARNGDSKTSPFADFVWHQRRKQIYGLYDDKASGRAIKAEFEPVKAWSEIKSEYDPQTRIKQRGWVKLKARITADEEAPFIPSIYGIEPLEVYSGATEALEANGFSLSWKSFVSKHKKARKLLLKATSKKSCRQMKASIRSH